jgi:predicted aminopeptidase
MTASRPLRRNVPGPIRFLAMGAAAWLLAACAGPGYYVQAIDGHLDMMRKRQGIAELLQSPGTPPALASDLRLAAEVRRFAVERLGLPDNGSYEHYVATGRDAVTWNVVAAPELSLQPRRWCFLFAGCVPYRGYFEQAAADRFAARLASKGLDVAVSPAVAYSTLGWFEDPLLDTMFRYGDERLAALVFHEMAHQRLYVPGDAAFNESYASFIEEIGVKLWLAGSGRSDRLEAWERQREAGRQFDTLLADARRRLARLYASPVTDAEKRRGKRTVFDALERAYRQLVDGPWSGRDLFAGWFRQAPNNARLALYESYRGGVCAFAALYAEAMGDLQRFQSLAEARAALGPDVRREWLRQDCPAVASRGNL